MQKPIATFRSRQLHAVCVYAHVDGVCVHACVVHLCVCVCAMQGGPDLLRSHVPGWMKACYGDTAPSRALFNTCLKCNSDIFKNVQMATFKQRSDSSPEAWQHNKGELLGKLAWLPGGQPALRAPSGRNSERRGPAGTARPLVPGPGLTS